MPFYVEDSDDTESRRRTFKNLNSEQLQRIIKEEKKEMNFDGPIVSIIQVLIILRKIDDFAQVK